MKAWRRRLRRLRRWLVGLATLAILLIGLLVALLSRLLPMLETRPQQVADWLARRAGVEVHIDQVRAEWNGRGIRFDIGGLRLGIGDGLRIDHAILQLNAFTGLLPGSPLTSLQLQSPSIAARRGADGRWTLDGLGQQHPSEMPDLALIERLGEVVLDGAKLRLTDDLRGTDWTLQRVDARLRTQGGRVRAGLRAYQAGAQPVQIRLDLDSTLRDGRLYAQVPDSALAPWLADWMPAEWTLPEARLWLEAWARLQDGRIEQARFDARLNGAAARIEGEVVQAPGGPLALPELRLRGNWQGSTDAWQLRFEEFDAQAGWARLDRRGSDWQLDATGWRLDRWAPWLAQAPGLSPGQRAQLGVRAPSGRIDGLRLIWGEQQPLQVQALASDLGLLPFGRQPGFAHLDLAVDGIGERVAIELAAPKFRFDWPTGLRGSMHPDLRGNLLLWRDDDVQRSWCLSALDLQLDEATQYRVDAEAEMCFDGGLPHAEIRAEVAPADITVAKRFWIMDKMPEPAVRWLDDALVDGRLARGRVLLSGDLADWPFHDGRGRFEAIADLDEVTLSYRPDWPRGEHISGEARFVNAGMAVDLHGEVAGVPVERVTGGIEQFRDANLVLDIDGRANGQRLIEFLRQTPVWTHVAAGLDHVAIEGPAEVSTRLDLILKSNARAPRVDGRVRLRDADLRQSAWGLAFDAARGDIVFSERGARIDAMDLLHVGRPAKFSLAVGSFVDDPANSTEAGLSGRLDAQALIDTQPDLNWLKPFLAGTSKWDIALRLPNGAHEPALHLQSDLVGTELLLPAPLRKSEAVPMKLDLRLGLGEQARAVDLRLGELLRLRGVLADGEPFNGLAEFGEGNGLERPQRGIAVVGQVPVLDASGWLGIAVGGGEGLLQSVDLQCGELDLLGRSFTETRAGFRREGGGLRIDFDGPRLAGTIAIPKESELLQRGVTARFDRLQWNAVDDETAGPGDLDPRLLPPLHVHVQALSVGGAELGETRLETFPTPQGMRIEQWLSRSPALELSARGDWQRGSDGDRSSFDVEFTAQDLGAMLKALGFSEFVEGGQTLATLKARWEGSPAAFGLEKSDGELSLSIGKGRIPDVEPGAGRLFGLLSLSQIPRRLALDFSDFFRSGLAFNRIEGKFALGGGHARTDDLRIDSPAADIRISGSTGLATQTYDQRMEVLPRAGSVLPIVGALAGGPAGAALGAVAQAVLQNPFKQMTRTVYRVTGPWNKPQIDAIERGPARGEKRPAEGADGGAADAAIEPAVAPVLADSPEARADAPVQPASQSRNDESAAAPAQPQAPAQPDSAAPSPAAAHPESPPAPPIDVVPSASAATPAQPSPQRAAAGADLARPAADTTDALPASVPSESTPSQRLLSGGDSAERSEPLPADSAEPGRARNPLP